MFRWLDAPEHYFHSPLRPANFLTPYLFTSKKGLNNFYKNEQYIFEVELCCFRDFMILNSIIFISTEISRYFLTVYSCKVFMEICRNLMKISS